MKLAAISILLTTALATTALAVEGDYDGDGRSDLALARASRSTGKTSWFVRTMAGQRVNYTLGSPGDAFVPGDFDGDGRTQPAVVYVLPNADLEWRTINSDGSESVEVFGINQDTPLVGDFDCDGKADKAVNRASGALRRWSFQLSSGQSLANVAFGKNTDVGFAADVDGNGCDEMVIARSENNLIYWFVRAYNGSATTQIQWGWSSDSLLRPFDMNQDGRDDLIVLRRTGSTDHAYVRYDENSSAVVPLGRSGPTTFMGSFSGAGTANFGRFARNSNAGRSGVFTLKPETANRLSMSFGRSDDVLIRPDGTAVASGSGQTVGELGCSVTKTFSDGGYGALWKPVSDSTGRAVFLLPKSYYTSVRSVDVVNSGGTVVATASKRPYIANGDRSHFDLSKTASQLDAYKPITVRLKLTNNTVECRTVPTPKSRID